MSISNTKMASATATTMMSSPGTHAAPIDSTRLTNSSKNSVNLSSDSRNPDISSPGIHAEIKTPTIYNPENKTVSIPVTKDNHSKPGLTSFLRQISFLIATLTTAIAAPACLIFGEKNPIRKFIEALATQSVNLSLGWMAGITGVLDQLRRKDLPMVMIQVGDSLATLLSPLANKTMNRGVWIGGMNIVNFLKKYISEKPDFSSFGESISWTSKALLRYFDELRSKGLKAIFTDHKSTAFGITTSLFTILGSVVYFITGDKNFAPIVRHAGGGFSEIQKFSGDNLESGRTNLVNAGVSMLGSSILDAGGKFISQFNPALGQALNFGSQSLNNYGRGNQLESQKANELGHSYEPITFTGALGQGFKEFFDLGSIVNYFNKETIPVMEMKPHVESAPRAATPGKVATATARPKAGFHSSNGSYGGSSSFGRTSARPGYSGANSTANGTTAVEAKPSSAKSKQRELFSPSATMLPLVNDSNLTRSANNTHAEDYVNSTHRKHEHFSNSWNKQLFSNSEPAQSTSSGSGSQVSNGAAQSTSSGSGTHINNSVSSNSIGTTNTDSKGHIASKAAGKVNRSVTYNTDSIGKENSNSSPITEKVA